MLAGLREEKLASPSKVGRPGRAAVVRMPFILGFFAQPPNKVYFGASLERSCGMEAEAKAGMIAAIFMLAGALVHLSQPQRLLCGHATGEIGVGRAVPADGRGPARARRAGDQAAHAVAPTRRPRCGGH